MKVCGKCLIEKADEDFHKRGNILQSVCKACKSFYSSQKYQTDPTYRLKRRVSAVAMRNSNRAFMNRYKKFCGCKLCGEAEPIALDFHHLDPSQKDYEPSQAKTMSRSVIKAEIRKCVVLCANCHRKVHAGILTV